jgi:hypothetical protein
MENNEEFKRVVASIQALEQQLLQVDEKHLEQQGIKIEYLRELALLCLVGSPILCLLVLVVLDK